ncbi:hypothetical protein Cgig2_030920 [Carnegiea gigantea]|uniref:Inositol oxygenase n=1 Tax=Carnegiea gigantea TaxID=171969 RepID=A0A9Q1KJP0_9CARY|nr:hypothetical protein Cgig2_030920 [Carnegiea gigantea]
MQCELRRATALHRAGAYKYLLNEEDKENLKWLQIFNNYDLYSKSKVRIDVEKVKPYYLSLIEKTEDESKDDRDDVQTKSRDEKINKELCHYYDEAFERVNKSANKITQLFFVKAPRDDLEEIQEEVVEEKQIKAENSHLAMQLVLDDFDDI